jgi:hypothetical protein
VVGATLAVVGVVGVAEVGVSDGELGVGLGAGGLVDGVSGEAADGVGVVALGENVGGEALEVEGTADAVGDGVRVRVLDGVGSETVRDGVGIETDSDPDGRGRLAPPSHDDARTAIVESATSASAQVVNGLPLGAILSARLSRRSARSGRRDGALGRSP